MALSLVVLPSCSTPPAPPSPSLPATDITLTPDTALIEGAVPRNTTLASMLTAHGLAGDAVTRVVAAAQSVFDPRRLRSSQPFSLERTLEGALRLFEYEIDPDWFLRVTPVSTGASEVRAELAADPENARAEVRRGHDWRRNAIAVRSDGGRG